MVTNYTELAVPGIQQLKPYIPGKPMKELEREYGVSNIVKLASNENLLGPSPLALEAVNSALGEIHFYPDANGFELKEALANKHQIDPACITLGNGSNDVLVLLAQVFLNPGDEVVFSEYAFAVYSIACQSVSAKMKIAKALPVDSDMPYGHDLQAMKQLLTLNTKLVFIANPNNPTGTYVDPNELRQFIANCSPNTIVVVDEAYYEYGTGESQPNVVSWLAEFSNLVVTRTFSKAYGLSGLRIGYALSNPEIADLLNRLRQPFNVNHLGLMAATAALSDNDHIQKTRNFNLVGMQQLISACNEWNLSYVPSAANFLLIDLKKPAHSIFEALLRQAVIVRPVDNYGLPNHIRVTIGLKQHNQRFIQAMNAVLLQYG